MLGADLLALDGESVRHGLELRGAGSGIRLVGLHRVVCRRRVGARRVRRAAGSLLDRAALQRRRWRAGQLLRGLARRRCLHVTRNVDEHLDVHFIGDGAGTRQRYLEHFVLRKPGCDCYTKRAIMLQFHASDIIRAECVY